MKQISYHGYRVIGTAKNHEGTWRPRARVSCDARGRQEVELQDTNCFVTEGEAEEYALRLGKHWVNKRRLRRVVIPRS
jgi:hypothetical protein